MPLTIGEQLKQARLARNASIDDVSRALHIRPFFIEALEDNRFTDIPSMVQVKGFIRLYAGWLELSPQSFLNILEGKSEEPFSEQAVPSSVETKKTSLKPGKTRKKAPPTEPAIDVVAEKENPSSEPSPQDNPTTENSGDVEIESNIKTQITSQDLFLQIGQQLRTCRTSLNISVEDIEKLTHIRSRYLVDMETGNFNDIPSLVQARGLLNGYASFLNLDADVLLGIFAEALQKRRIELLPPSSELTPQKKAAKSSEPKKERTGLKRFLTVDFIVGSVTIIGLVVFGIWSASQVLSTRRNTSEKPPAIAEVLAQNPTAELINQSTGTIEPTDIARNPDSIGKLPTNLPPVDNFAAGGSPTPPVPSLGKASMQVYIVPNQRVFLQVTTGKKVVFIGRTIPGNAYPFTSDERIEVVSGNAAALQIYYNQRDLGTLGLPGQPLRLVFSKDGITTPTLAITTLPTSTAMATLTLRPTSTPVPPTVTPLIP